MVDDGGPWASSDAAPVQAVWRNIPAHAALRCPAQSHAVLSSELGIPQHLLSSKLHVQTAQRLRDVCRSAVRASTYRETNLGGPLVALSSDASGSASTAAAGAPCRPTGKAGSYSHSAAALRSSTALGCAPNLLTMSPQQLLMMSPQQLLMMSPQQLQLAIARLHTHAQRPANAPAPAPAGTPAAAHDTGAAVQDLLARVQAKGLFDKDAGPQPLSLGQDATRVSEHLTEDQVLWALLSRSLTQSASNRQTLNEMSWSGDTEAEAARKVARKRELEAEEEAIQATISGYLAEARPLDLAARLASLGRTAAAAEGSATGAKRRPELGLFGAEVLGSGSGALMARALLVLRCSSVAAHNYEGEHEAAKELAAQHRRAAAALTDALLSYHGMPSLPYGELVLLSDVIAEMQDQFLMSQPDYAGCGFSLAAAWALYHCLKGVADWAVVQEQLPLAAAYRQRDGDGDGDGDAAASSAGRGLAGARVASLRLALQHMRRGSFDWLTPMAVLVHCDLLEKAAERMAAADAYRGRQPSEAAAGETFETVYKGLIEERLEVLRRYRRRTELERRRQEQQRRLRQKPQQQQQRQRQLREPQRAAPQGPGPGDAVSSSASAASTTPEDAGARSAVAARAWGIRDEAQRELLQRLPGFVVAPGRAYAVPSVSGGSVVLQHGCLAVPQNPGSTRARDMPMYGCDPWAPRQDLVRLLLAAYLDRQRVAFKAVGPAAVQLVAGAVAAANLLSRVARLGMRPADVDGSADGGRCGEEQEEGGTGGEGSEAASRAADTGAGVVGQQGRLPAGAAAAAAETGAAHPPLVALQLLPWRFQGATEEEAVEGPPPNGYGVTALLGGEELAQRLAEALPAGSSDYIGTALSRGEVLVGATCSHNLDYRIEQALGRHKYAVLECCGRAAVERAFQTVVQIHLKALRRGEKLLVVPLLSETQQVELVRSAGLQLGRQCRQVAEQDKHKQPPQRHQQQPQEQQQQRERRRRRQQDDPSTTGAATAAGVVPEPRTDGGAAAAASNRGSETHDPGAATQAATPEAPDADVAARSSGVAPADAAGGDSTRGARSADEQRATAQLAQPAPSASWTQPPPAAGCDPRQDEVPIWQAVQRAQFNYELCRLLALHPDHEELLGRGLQQPGGGAALGGAPGYGARGSSCGASLDDDIACSYAGLECRKQRVLCMSPRTALRLAVLLLLGDGRPAPAVSAAGSGSEGAGGGGGEGADSSSGGGGGSGASGSHAGGRDVACGAVASSEGSDGSADAGTDDDDGSALL